MSETKLNEKIQTICPNCQSIQEFTKYHWDFALEVICYHCNHVIKEKSK